MPTAPERPGLTIVPPQAQQGDVDGRPRRSRAGRKPSPFEAAFAASPVGMAIVDSRGTISIANASVARLAGRRAEELTGLPLETLLDGPDRGTDLPLHALVAAGDSTASIERPVAGGGGATWVRATATLMSAHDPDGHRLVQLVDISQQVAVRELLAHHADHDALTGLPNRSLLLRQMQAAFHSGQAPAVLYIDLDGFKVINDSDGHSTGDLVLLDIAQRLRSAVRPGDLISRLGGDEFVLLRDTHFGLDELHRCADRVHELLLSPITVGGRDYTVTASVGIATSHSAIDPAAMLRNADLAMYAAKALGRARSVAYTPDLHEAALTRLHGEQLLRRALDADEFELHYQPIFRLGDDVAVGVEALLRWRHPTSGVMSAAEFIDVAEDSGLIVPIGAWVIEEACRQLAVWRAQMPGRALQMAVNVSPQQLTRSDLVETLTGSMRRHGFDPAAIVLEITESTLLRATSQVAADLAELRSRGVRVALDDFGTGYSSMSYLKQLPIDIIKVDRSFVTGTHDDRRERSVLAAMCVLARALGMESVVEGVETQADLELVSKIGATYVQGFRLAGPEAPRDLTL